VTALVILSRRDDDQARHESRPGASVGPLPIANVVLFGVVIFLYSGVEMALGGWLPEYARRASTAEVARWAAVGTAFWGGLSAGRGAIAVRLESRHEDAALFAGLLLATAGVLVLLRVQSYALLPAIAGICGFGLGPVFPVTAAAVSRRMPTSVAGPLLSLGSLGGAVVPWFVGLVSDRFRSLASGFTALLALLALLIGLHVMRRAGERARDGAPGPAR
jgi:fucose permease